MTRELRLFELRLGLMVAIALGALRAPAQTRPTRVLVQAAARDQATLERLIAELRSDGFEAQPVAMEEPPPCAPEARRAPPRPDEQDTPYAGIEIERDASGARLVARLCHVPAPERAVVSAPVEDSGRLALAAVEALNGLTASAGRAAPAPREVSPERALSAPSAARVALNATALLVLQPLGGRPFAGTSVGVEHALHPDLALELEVFMPIVASAADGPDRELSTAAAWARFGARTQASLPWLKLGASLQAGWALIWATARSRDPALVGGTELAKAAVLSAGLSLESPDDSLLYLRATSQVSRLVPSARVELGGGRVQDFGNLLLEIGLGVGVRWPPADSELSPEDPPGDVR